MKNSTFYITDIHFTLLLKGHMLKKKEFLKCMLGL
jgi:hypothetical protein